MKTLFRLFFCTFFITCLYSCKKDNDSPSAIVGKWQYLSEYGKYYYQGNFYHDTTFYYSDTYTQFGSDGRATTSSPDTTISFSYTYDDANHTMVVVRDGDTTHVHYDVREITGSDLILYYEQTGIPDLLFTYLVTLKK